MPRSSRSPLAVLFLLLAAAPGAQAAAPTMPLSDVRPGMRCTAVSVVAGIDPVAFDAEVLMVQGGLRPQDSLIVMRFSGPAVDGTGIGQGFSGSPVSCPRPDGTLAVIGAISQGVGQYDNLVAGVTPIDAMLATPTWADGPKRSTVGQASAPAAKTARRAATPSARAARRLVSARRVARSAMRRGRAGIRSRELLATGTSRAPLTPRAAWNAGRPQLLLRGPSGPLAQAIERASGQAGRPLVSVAGRSAYAGSGAPQTQTLRPGDAVSTDFVTGDVSVGAIGTVTYVDGDQVWAFGHPLRGTGASRLLMQRAAIGTVISSPSLVDAQVSYKLGSSIGVAGTLGFDGAAAVGGRLGSGPAVIPTSVTLRDERGSVLGAAQAAVVDETSVRGGSTPEMLPLAASANAATALQRIARSAAVAGSVRTCTTIFLRGHEVPLYQCADAVYPTVSEYGGAETDAAGAIGSAVGLATSAERFTGLIRRIRVEMTVRDEADGIEIVRVRTPKRVRAGRPATLRVVVVQASTGERREIPVKVDVPAGTEGSRVGVALYGGGSSSLEDALFMDLFGDYGSAAPKNLPALRSLYTQEGLSGIRAVALPGLAGSTVLGLTSGEIDPDQLPSDGSDVRELLGLFDVLDRAPVAVETPTLSVSGGASITLRPR